MKRLVNQPGRTLPPGPGRIGTWAVLPLPLGVNCAKAALDGIGRIEGRLQVLGIDPRHVAVGVEIGLHAEIIRLRS